MRMRWLPAGLIALPFVISMSAATPHAWYQPPLVIKVDAVDPANQQFLPPFNRSFEYSDFFPRALVVSQGKVLDFQTQPNGLHEVVFSSSEQLARLAYPLVSDDVGDPNLAPGSGLPKIELGPGSGPITGGSTTGGGTLGGFFGQTPCGLVQSGQSACKFSGGTDVESQGQVQAGPTAAVDWDIAMDAPPGLYTFFCMLHPGMRGAVFVVSDLTTTGLSTQTSLDTAARSQFLQDQQAALTAEKAANVITYSGGAPGTRTYFMSVGISAASDHVAINEMLPNVPLPLTRGDKVQFNWPDDHNFHTVGFPGSGDARIQSPLPEPLAFDCGPTVVYIGSGVCTEPGQTVPELIGDPGNAAPGTALTAPNTIVNGGLRFGTAFQLPTSSQQYSVTTTQATPSGAYLFQCTIHDWMQGQLDL